MSGKSHNKKGTASARGGTGRVGEFKGNINVDHKLSARGSINFKEKQSEPVKRNHGTIYDRHKPILEDKVKHTKRSHIIPETTSAWLNNIVLQSDKSEASLNHDKPPDINIVTSGG